MENYAIIFAIYVKTESQNAKKIFWRQTSF